MDLLGKIVMGVISFGLISITVPLFAPRIARYFTARQKEKYPIDEQTIDRLNDALRNPEVAERYKVWYKRDAMVIWSVWFVIICLGILILFHEKVYLQSETRKGLYSITFLIYVFSALGPAYFLGAPLMRRIIERFAPDIDYGAFKLFSSGYIPQYDESLTVSLKMNTLQLDRDLAVIFTFLFLLTLIAFLFL